ncbi:MAG: O-antigen ligase family protein [Cetobacterium sp.]
MICNKKIKHLNLMGEISIYLFIITLFINRGLNLKIGYIVQGLFVLKLIFDRQNIKIKGKEIYKMFGIILVFGILMNLFVSKKNGWEIFFNQNIKFLFGMAFLSFIDNSNKIKKSLIAIMIGSSVTSISEIFNMNFIEYSQGRTRPLIMMGSIFSTIYIFEKIKTWAKEKKIDYSLIMIIPAIINTLGIMYSDSRMGFIVYVLILILYLIYNLIYNKMKLERIVVLIITILAVSAGLYKTMPEEFNQKIKTSFETKNNISNEARLIMWNGGFKAFKSNPITGVGSAKQDTQPYNMISAEEYGNEYFKYEFIQNKRFTEHHSIYVNFLSQNGLIVTILFLYLFFIQTYKRFKDNIKEVELVASYFTLLSFLVYGITWSTWTLYSVSQILFQIFLAILIYRSEKVS